VVIDAWDPATTQQLREIFAEEAAEHLAVLGEQLPRLAKDPNAVQEALRRAHTLKGSAGTVGFFCLQHAAHRLEEVLVRLRDKELKIDALSLERIISASELLAPIVNAKELSTAEALAERFSRELHDLAGSPMDALPHIPGYAPSRRLRERRFEDLSTFRLGVEQLESLMGVTEDLVAVGSQLEGRGEAIVGASQRLAALRGALHSALGEDSNAIDELENLVRSLEEVGAGVLEDSANLGRETQSLGDALTRVRMMPVGWLFARLQRQLHDLCIAEDKEVDLITDGDQVEVDRTLLERLTDPMVHLLANAVAHGIELPDLRRVAGKPSCGRVSVSACQEGGHLCLRVEDDGAGIDHQAVRAAMEERGEGQRHALGDLVDVQVLDVIFFPGFTTRAHADKVSGLGVGLDVVRRSVAALGGEVKVRSTQGVGTSFSIRLPVARAVQSEELEVGASPPRVLLVDDSAAIREALGAILRDAGYVVQMACNGLEAWTQLCQGGVDLLVTDLEMPHLHGLALIEKCRRVEETATLPILALSSRTAQHKRQEVRDAGADSFLGKPVSQESLLVAIGKLLGARALG